MEIRDYFEQLLEASCSLGASDLHLSEGCPALVRRAGELSPLENFEIGTNQKLHAIIRMLLNVEQYAHFEEFQNCDFGYTSQQKRRFRINAYIERKQPALAIRWLQDSDYSFENLHLPEQLKRLVTLKDGLVLLTGATGSGKSTTLATLINAINQTRNCHILTIEDPIEYIHYNQKALVHQREVGTDVPSFARAIRAALREDPDVILLGEMRDLETMRAAISAAETGHLVFSTLHTNDAIGAVERLVGAFPGNEQSGVRQQLSLALRAVITQSLVQTIDGKRRVPVNEILMINSAAANLIRHSRPEQIRSQMETGSAIGNQTFEQALARRVKEGLIAKETAERLVHRPELFAETLRNIEMRAEYNPNGAN